MGSHAGPNGIRGHRMSHVLMVMSEALPYSKSGGLGDVGGGLPLALGRLGHRVTLALPKYRGTIVGERAKRITLDSMPGSPALQVVEEPLSERVEAWLVDYPPFFDREGIYGVGAKDYSDNDRRFALLARAALDATIAADTRPDIVHAHDWQAGLVPFLLRSSYATSPVLAGLPSLFTIHNLAYQGLFPADSLAAIGLDRSSFTSAGLEYWGKVSYLKAGINYSTLVSTVSKRYAEEIQTPEQGFGFDGILRQRNDKLYGIRNGIDTELWNPRTDRFLPAPFDADDLTGKRRAKQALLERFRMRNPAHERRALIGMVARMVDQKGLDIIEAASPELMRLDATIVVLGTGERRYQEMWQRLGRRYPARVAATIGFDEALAHLIEAGSDIFLMPSRFEPCGLNQMYSLRYGTVPVVHATGGLEDSVRQVDPASGAGTGFKYRAQTAEEMLATLRLALEWFQRPDAWRRIQIAGMREDNSWDAAAREYERVYERAQAMSAGGSTKA